MSQVRRRALITAILERGHATSQEAIVAQLASQGITATQATVSRDLAALGAIKGINGYQFPPAGIIGSTSIGSLQSTLMEHVLDVIVAHSIVVLKTAAGHANAVGVALDRSPPPQVVGTIAGDDTLFLAATDPIAAEELAGTLRNMLQSEEAA